MVAQSQGLSLHPLDQQSLLKNVAICNFSHCPLYSPHPNIPFSTLKLLQHYPLFYSQFLFYSLTALVFWSLCLLKSLSPSIFTGAPWNMFFFIPCPLFDFFYARCLIKELQKSKFAFFHLCSHLPLCASPFFAASLRHSVPSPFVSVCSCSAETEKKPQNRKCGCLWTRMRESVPASLTLPLCQCLPLGCQWQSEFICCAVTGLMIDVAPANSKPIRRLM